MSFIRDHVKICNYNPLAMLSPLTGVMATGPIDGIMDHNSWRDILKILALPYVVPATLLIGMEIGIDCVFRREIGKRKFRNLVDLVRNHKGLDPSRNYDLFYSIEAEAAASCPYGEDIVHLVSMGLTIEDDFEDRYEDGDDNIFQRPKDEVLKIFNDLDIDAKIKRIESLPPVNLEKLPVYRWATHMGFSNPIKTYEDMRLYLDTRIKSPSSPSS